MILLQILFCLLPANATNADEALLLNQQFRRYFIEQRGASLASEIVARANWGATGYTYEAHLTNGETCSVVNGEAPAAYAGSMVRTYKYFVTCTNPQGEVTFADQGFRNWPKPSHVTNQFKRSDVGFSNRD